MHVKWSSLFCARFLSPRQYHPRQATREGQRERLVCHVLSLFFIFLDVVCVRAEREMSGGAAVLCVWQSKILQN
jgi:hypothetical protein